MNAKAFSDAMGEINDKYVDEAIRYQRKGKINNLVKWGTVAACFALALIISIPMLINRIESQPNNPIGDIAPLLVVNGILYRDSPQQESYNEMLPEFAYLGEIVSVVAPDAVPHDELQANHDILGAKVYQYGDEIVVLINDKYWVYIEIGNQETDKIDFDSIEENPMYEQYK